jgi:hypothetical protein
MICLLDVLKRDLGEVFDAMFQSVEGPFEVTFWSQVNEKSELDEAG